MGVTIAIVIGVGVLILGGLVARGKSWRAEGSQPCRGSCSTD